MLLTVYSQQPSFTAISQNAQALRGQVDGWWVDYTVELPSTFEVLMARRYPNPRPLLAIITDINTLTTGPQKLAIWNDLKIGTPQKWALSAGPNQQVIAAMASLITLTAPLEASLVAADVAAAKTRAVAMFVQDNPFFLVNPVFAPTISIPGK